MIPERPKTVHNLSAVLVRLATEGRIPVDETFALWLKAIGVADVIGEELQAREEWVGTAFPARDPRDLVRRTAFRDPAYRHHLDSLLGEVLVRMGRDDRLAKVEEYLTKQLSRFAPRFALLLSQADCESTETTTHPNPTTVANSSNSDLFEEWDNNLFGAVLGGAAQRFPLVAEIYGPQASVPVYINATSYGITEQERGLLAALIDSATERHGVALAEQQRDIVTSIRSRTHLPIRIWTGTDSTSGRAACVSPIVLIAPISPKHVSHDRCSVPGRLSRELVSGRIHDSKRMRLAQDIWTVVDERHRAGAYPGFDIYDSHVNAREFIVNQGTDYLAWLSKHCLFGLLFQFFVIGSFDRELADDSITVLPVGSPKQPERVDVYYRPDGTESRYAVLGSLDEVLTIAAQHLGLYTPPRLWSEGPFSLWTQSLLVLLEAKVLSFQSGEYLLEKGVFDECHSRDHMQAILRRGRMIRDEIKVALRARYQESTTGESRIDNEETIGDS